MIVIKQQNITHPRTWINDYFIKNPQKNITVSDYGTNSIILTETFPLNFPTENLLIKDVLNKCEYLQYFYKDLKNQEIDVMNMVYQSHMYSSGVVADYFSNIRELIITGQQVYNDLVWFITLLKRFYNNKNETFTLTVFNDRYNNGREYLNNILINFLDKGDAYLNIEKAKKNKLNITEEIKFIKRDVIATLNLFGNEIMKTGSPDLWQNNYDLKVAFNIQKKIARLSAKTPKPTIIQFNKIDETLIKLRQQLKDL